VSNVTTEVVEDIKHHQPNILTH